MKSRRYSWWLIVLSGLATASFGAKSKDGPSKDNERIVLENGIVPTGSLGFPLGHLLRIEGTEIHEALGHGCCTLRVDTVNGKAVADPIDIWVENIECLPEKGRIVIRGYEMCRMIGDPPAVIVLAREAGRTIPPRQAGWQMQMIFVPLLVEAPKNLKIRARE